MLRFLAIRHFIIVEELEVAFAPTFTVVTGETGAGKSILIDALGFALGEKAPDSPGAQVSLEAEADGPLQAFLEDKGLKNESEPDRVILRRLLTQDGRSRCFINGTSVTMSVLKELGTRLVSFHHQDERITEPRHQRQLLDDYGNLQALKDQVALAFSLWQEKEKEVLDLRDVLEKASQDQDFWQESLEELRRFHPLPEEETILLDERGRWREREGSLVLLDRLETSLAGPPSLEERIRQVVKDVEKISEEGKLLERLEQALEACHHVEHWVSGRRAALEEGTTHPPDEIEARLFELRRLARKHAVMPNELASFQETLNGRLQAVNVQESLIPRLDEERQRTKTVYEEAARQLTQERHATARRLEEAVHQRLPALKLPHARLRVDFQRKPLPQWNAEGTEAVTFYVQTNPGSLEGSLKEVASGGERARLLLALKAATAHVQATPTLIFDEIDQGVGGSVAEAMGMAIAELGQGGRQVIAITHAPQVAAVGQAHWVIEKRQGETSTTVGLRPLTHRGERVEEIARMLSGHDITVASRHVADQLLAAHHPDRRHEGR